MSAATTSLVIASRPDWTAQVVTAPSGTVSATVGGALYLDHPTTALSMIDQVAAISGVSACVLREDGLVSITLSSAGALTWGAATTLRDMLGFNGDRSSAATHVADVQSPLLWVPMREEIPETVLGSEGMQDPLVSTASGRDGYQTAVYFGGITTQEFEWQQVPKSRFDDSGASREWKSIYYASIVRFHRFLVHRDVEMDDASASAASYSGPLGPYQIRPGRRGGGRLDTQRSAGLRTADVNFDISLPCVKVPEYA